MIKDIYIDNYLNKKYEKYYLEILSEQITESRIFNNVYYLNSFTILDELIFVNLYYPEQYYEVLDKAKELTFIKISNLSKIEIDFLFIKFLEDFRDKLTISRDLKLYYVANELTDLI
ncbi:hypothetical protein V7075_28945, partial [Neobacillus drentensis]|uniref:hypothetical protein n=1 Tax=Neobacillus drentensis TaxID=220684 RepID=UPI002FFFCA38